MATVTGAAQRPPKAAMLVAQRIVRDVVRGGLRPGDLLPPERTMLEKYETGRGTLREALRLLEFQGVIALKPGPRGGPVLLDPDASHLASTVVLLMQLKDGAVPDNRRGPLRAGADDQLAGGRADAPTSRSPSSPARSRQMREEHRRPAHVPGRQQAVPRHHRLVVRQRRCSATSWTRCSGSWTAPSSGSTTPAPRRAAILKAHESIYGGHQRTGTRRSPRRRMRKHIDEYMRYAQRKFPEVLDQVIQWDRMI